MPSTYNTAFQETMVLLKGGLDTQYPNINVEWPNVKNEKPEERKEQTDQTRPWIRVIWQHIDSQQRTVGSVNGKRRFETTGLLTVSFFTPTGYGLEDIAAAMTYILDLFRGKTTASGVIFRQGQPNETQQDGPWFRSDALVDFQYDEFK